MRCSMQAEEEHQNCMGHEAMMALQLCYNGVHPLQGSPGSHGERRLDCHQIMLAGSFFVAPGQVCESGCISSRRSTSDKPVSRALGSRSVESVLSS